MSFDAELERICERVELVSGAGNREAGTFCIMSLVAHLAGEEHSDAPRTASPVVREFAVCINDALPARLRQRLKVFAPRIIGTNDGYDGERAELLWTAARAKVVPRVRQDFAKFGWLEGWYRRRVARGLAAAFFETSRSEGACTDHLARITFVVAVARLLAFAGAKAPIKAREWYWAEAMVLLDRMCDVAPMRVTAERRRPNDGHGARPPVTGTRRAARVFGSSETIG